MVKSNDDERMSFDGKELSPLAKRVPMVKETGNKAFDNNNKLSRKSMVKIIDAMCKRPKVVMPLLAYLESEDLEAEVPDIVDSEAWKGGYKQIDRIPKGWVSSWLLKCAQNNDILKLLSESYLSTVAAQDSDGISILFAFVTQVIGTMAMPELMQDDERGGVQDIL